MELVFTVNFWLIMGFSLLILEIFSGFFVALSFAIGSFVMALLLQLWPTLLNSWYEIIFLYSVISLLVTFSTWKIFKKNQETQADIND